MILLKKIIKAKRVNISPTGIRLNLTHITYN